MISHKKTNPRVTVDTNLLRKLANTVRGLSMDAVDKADSGHPGLPLGAADFAVTLWYYFLRHNPADPAWIGRDKFILSAGHGSMLIYSLLHLAGYDLTLDELKSFRQLHSRTPGHPESFLLPGVETTTGPLGQGVANGVGFALSDKMMAARVNRADFTPYENNVYVLCSDGDLMEGVAQEAMSLAGHLGLGNLICLYDDNSISLDGDTALSFSGERTAIKYEAMGWHIVTVDGHNHQAVADAIVEAKNETERPSLIICKTIIGYGSPKEGTSSVHGSPLGAENSKKTKEKLGIPTEPLFLVPGEDREAWAARAAVLKDEHAAWKKSVEEGRSKHPDAVAIMEKFHEQKLPENLRSLLPKFDPAKPIATRKAGQVVLEALGKHVPWLVGGSADLSVSTLAVVEDTRISREDFSGRHIFYGVREHGMGGIVNGMVRTGAFRAYGATFLTFSDYMRGSIRLSALMECPSIWVFTHDSIFLGEDGPTHQPVEHYAALRAIPNLIVFRPGDAVETGEAWVAMLEEKHTPATILLTRQNLPVYDRSTPEFKADGSVAHGGYTFRPEKNPGRLDGILIGTGSELHLCVEAARQLEANGASVRVVSLPSWELFDKQSAEYKNRILPPAVTKRISVEAGRSLGWERWVGNTGRMIAQDKFGASAPAKVLAKEFGFTVERIVGTWNEM